MLVYSAQVTPLIISEKRSILNNFIYKSCHFLNLRGGRGEACPPMFSPREKRYFTQKFAYLYGKYAKSKIRIPDPRPKVTQLPYAQRYLRRLA